MPIRRRFANRSMLFSASLQTRASFFFINSHTAVFEHATASQATRHRSRRCARRDDAPATPPARSAHGRGSSPAAHRPPLAH